MGRAEDVVDLHHKCTKSVHLCGNVRVVELLDGLKYVFDARHSLTPIPFDVRVVSHRRAEVLDAGGREEELGDVLVYEKLEGEIVQKADGRPPQLRLLTSN